MHTNDENLPDPTPVSPVKLTPTHLVQSPHGVAYNVLIKPASTSKVFSSHYSPSPKGKDIDDKLKSAETRRKNMETETQEKFKQKSEKIKTGKRQILDSIENHQKETAEKLQKKMQTVEDTLLQQKQELETKRLAREQKAQEAKKIHDDKLENRRKQAELRLSQLKLADDLREANVQAIVNKAQEDLIKVQLGREAQQKKKDELDEKVRNSLMIAEEKRLAQLLERKEKCGKHVEDAKRRASCHKSEG